MANYRTAFTHILPPDRLGEEHDSLEEFEQATAHHTVTQQKEYSLVVVTQAPRRILLGRKHRGFGKNMFNSFGGKIEPGETCVESACRELMEETGLEVAVEAMGRVGCMHFTFADSPQKMLVHVFSRPWTRCHLCSSSRNWI